MAWIPVSDPPPLKGDPLYKESDPVLVYTSYGTMLIATLEQGEEDTFPNWYVVPSEDCCLHDSVLFWMPLPKPPRDQS